MTALHIKVSAKGLLPHYHVEEEVVSAALSYAMDKWVDDVHDEARKLLVMHRSMDTGYLIDSWEIDKTKKLEKSIENTAPYSGEVEYGTGVGAGKPAYTPPKKPLVEWMISQLGMDEKTAWKKVWHLILHIRRFGTHPRPFMRPAVDYADSRFENHYEEGLKKYAKTKGKGHG